MGSVGGFAREGSYGGAEGSGSETAYEPVQQQGALSSFVLSQRGAGARR